MNRGALWATVHGVTKSWTQPKQLSTVKSSFLFICSPIVHTPHKCIPLISSFGLQVLMASFPLKNQVFINFAKDQKCYETADTSSQGSIISTDSQDDQLQTQYLQENQSQQVANGFILGKRHRRYKFLEIFNLKVFYCIGKLQLCKTSQ